MTHYKSTGQDSQGTTRDSTAFNIFNVFTLAGDPPPDPVLTIYSGQALASGLGPVSLRESRWKDYEYFGEYPSAIDSGVKVMLSQKQLMKLDMAGVFIKSNFPGDSIHHCPIPLKVTGRRMQGYRERMLCFREANLRETIFDYEEKRGSNYATPLLLAAMFLIPIAYGGVHLGALRIMFPTPIERLLWEIVCYFLIGFAALMGLLFFLLLVIGPALSLMDVRLLGFAGFKMSVPILPIYAAARVYIVIESFISLRHVPTGVYQTPDSNFMDYIPHL